MFNFKIPENLDDDYFPLVFDLPGDCILRKCSISKVKNEEYFFLKC
ncbi:MAG: hypothetical protein ABDH25_02080 [Dictyoglomaceae bacterium]